MFAFQVAFGPLASQSVHGLWLGCDLHCGHGGSGPMASSPGPDVSPPTEPPVT